ncbi:MAG: imelysin family protein [Geminicoccaceae bacterium]
MRGRLFVLLLAGLAAAIPARAASVLEDLNRQLTDAVIVPGYQRFAEATAALEAAVSEFCEAPTPDHLERARSAFEQAMLAWQHVQPVVFGPVVSGARTSIIQLFPDRRGAISRQLSQVLAARDPALLAPGGLEGKSVALTGFPALEQILYDDARLPTPEASGAATGADADYACGLAAAIARNLAGLAAGILDDWRRPGGFREAVLTAGAGNDAYFTAEDASGDLLKSLHTALQSVIALKLEAPLGAALEEAKPRRAESWRSELSLANIRANLETAEALYAGAGGFGAALAALADEDQLDWAIRRGFDRAFAQLDAIALPLPAAVEDPAARARIEALLAELRTLRLLVAQELAPALGLLVGFNAMDGD